MTLRRHQLPIAEPCGVFVGRPATADAPAFCTRCEKSVHDLSRLTEREVITLLARHRDGVCVSYRVGRDGTIATRKPPPPLGPAALAVAMTGCAGHLVDAERESDCVDAAGYHIDCPPAPRLGDAVIPDAPDGTADEAPVEDDDASVETVPIELEASEITRGLVLPDTPMGDPGHEPSSIAPVSPDDGDMLSGLVSPQRSAGRTSGAVVISDDMQRRVAREARRLERQEKRAQRRSARR